MELSKKEIKRVERLLDGCTVVIGLSFLYGVSGIIEDTRKREFEINDAMRQNDRSLLCSALKLCSRALCHHAHILCFYVARDLREETLQGKPYDIIKCNYLHMLCELM